MSLNVDWRNIKDYEEDGFIWRKIPGTDQLESTPMATTFAFLTMIVGIPEISDKTLNEFVLRVTAWEAAKGTCLVAKEAEGGGPRPITRADVLRFKGLRSNASSLTRAQFKRKLADSIFEELERRLRREQETHELEQRA